MEGRPGFQEAQEEREADLACAERCTLPVLVTGSPEFARTVTARLHAATGGSLHVIRCHAPAEEVEERLDAVLGRPPSTGTRDTVLLERIDALPPGLQRKLGGYIASSAARIVSTTESDLRALCEAGRFDDTTFYRLNAVHITSGNGPA
jgi:transcriptional regulator of acetoin/glycerol metabolism